MHCLTSGRFSRFGGPSRLAEPPQTTFQEAQLHSELQTGVSDEEFARRMQQEEDSQYYQQQLAMQEEQLQQQRQQQQLQGEADAGGCMISWSRLIAWCSLALHMGYT